MEEAWRIALCDAGRAVICAKLLLSWSCLQHWGERQAFSLWQAACLDVTGCCFFWCMRGNCSRTLSSRFARWGTAVGKLQEKRRVFLQPRFLGLTHLRRRCDSGEEQSRLLCPSGHGFAGGSCRRSTPSLGDTGIHQHKCPSSSS